MPDSGLCGHIFSPVALLKSSSIIKIKKRILYYNNKETNFKGTRGGREQSLTSSKDSFQLLFMQFRSSSAFNKDLLSIFVFLGPDVLMLSLLVL